MGFNPSPLDFKVSTITTILYLHLQFTANKHKHKSVYLFQFKTMSHYKSSQTRHSSVVSVTHAQALMCSEHCCQRIKMNTLQKQVCLTGQSNPGFLLVRKQMLEPPDHMHVMFAITPTNLTS